MKKHKFHSKSTQYVCQFPAIKSVVCSCGGDGLVRDVGCGGGSGGGGGGDDRIVVIIIVLPCNQLLLVIKVTICIIHLGIKYKMVNILKC